MKIAIVDDLNKNLKLYSEVLGTEFEIETYSKPEEFLFQLPDFECDLVLLDWHMPIVNGYEVLKRIRLQKPTIPVVMITAEYVENNLIDALDMGADDFVVKPVSNTELIARIKNKIFKTRMALQEKERQRTKAVQFNDDSHCIIINGATIQLQNKEYRLLRYIANNEKRIISREEIMSHIWNNVPEVSTTTLDTHLSILRKKLGEHSKLIMTKKGHGYVFDASEYENNLIKN